MADELKGRLTVRVPKKYLDLLEGLVREGIYSNKNEAVREALRRLFEYYGILRQGEEKTGKPI